MPAVNGAGQGLTNGWSNTGTLVTNGWTAAAALRVTVDIGSVDVVHREAEGLRRADHVGGG